MRRTERHATSLVVVYHANLEECDKFYFYQFLCRGYKWLSILGEWAFRGPNFCKRDRTLRSSNVGNKRKMTFSQSVGAGSTLLTMLHDVAILFRTVTTEIIPSSDRDRFYRSQLLGVSPPKSLQFAPQILCKRSSDVNNGDFPKKTEF